MPIIKIEFDNEKVKHEEIVTLSNAIQKIVSETTGIEDVSVYGNSSEIKIKIAPIEIFIEMSAHKINDVDTLVAQIKEKLSQWKRANSYLHPINLTLIPMNWKLEIAF